MPDRIRLDGRVAVVTGAAGVIGTATIRLLAERGARIVAVDRREVQDGRIYIEKINGPFLYVDRATPAEYSAGLALAIERGWLELHDSGTFVRFTQSGADLFA